MRGFAHRDARNGSALTIFVIVVYVLGILGFLAFQRGNFAGTVCKKTRPLSQVIHLKVAIHNFHTEYGVLPAEGSHVRTDGPDGVKFLTALLGLEGQAVERRNPRNIRFLAERERRNHKDGLQYSENGNRVEGLYDPWGNPLFVELNAKNEVVLRFRYGSGIVELRDQLCAVYSVGKDGKPGGGDDVISWIP